MGRDLKHPALGGSEVMKKGLPAVMPAGLFYVKRREAGQFKS